MNRNAAVATFLTLSIWATTQLAIAEPAEATSEKVRIACVGDSITFGARLTDRAADSYPAQLQKLLGNTEVTNFGVGGCTLIRKGRPTVWDQLEKIRQSNPDIVVISLGTNDTCGGSRKCWDHEAEFPQDCRDLVDAIRAFPSSPKVWLCAPTPMVLETPGLNESRKADLTERKVRLQHLITEIKKVAKEKQTGFIDLNTPMADHPELLTESDGVHPNQAGYLAVAKLVADALEGEIRRKPNVILILTDDQGYGDLSCHGNPVLKTPNMDALYDESVRLTNFHVDPTCAPTRSAIMTGCYSHRVKVWHTIMCRNHLLAGQPTMADVFAENGYQTALFGKWHLGANYPYRPMDRGFQQWLGQGDGGTGTTPDYWANDRVNDHYIRNGQFEQIDGWAPDVFYNEAIQYVRKNRDRPFFLYLPTYVPHSPHTVPDKAWAEPYLDKASLPQSYFFASIARVDANIGRLRACLDDLGIADNTIVIFMTDNGGTGGVKVFNAGMRGQKGSEYDGGHRVPCFIHWPTGELDQPCDVDRIAAHIDLLPTLIDLCSLTPPEGVTLDGTSLKTLLYNPKADTPQRTLFVESQRIMMPELWRKCSVMTDRWRLVNGSELYDMHADPGQKSDLATTHPEILLQLRQAYLSDFWPSVTEGDELFAEPIVGTEQQYEIMMSGEDGYPVRKGDTPAWSQGHVVSGVLKFTYWKIHVAKEGVYQFEVRRWPREADTPITEACTFDKVPDAWTPAGPITGTIYGGKPKALPVSKIRLRVGEYEETVDVQDGQKACVFTMRLPEGSAKVEALMIDENGNPLGSAYYAYIKPVPASTP